MLGVRDGYDSTKAMFHHSLFSDWLHENGMKTDKRDESTRDIICMDYQFGLRSYEEEKSHIKELRKKAQKIENENERNERLNVINDIELKIDSRKDNYHKMSKDEVREYTYVNGIYIDYPQFDKKKNIIGYERIYYKYLYRNPSMAKVGKNIWINAELYDKAYEHITMGIGSKMPLHNAKITEISAYASLLASSIEGSIVIPVENILILQDVDSFYKTVADVIRTEEYKVYEGAKYGCLSNLVTKKKCVISREDTEVMNELFDGQALIETSITPDWCNGMLLLRNHFFKACAFKTKIQLFIKEYCEERGIDYDTFEVEDMFGRKLAKNIQMITSNNAIKYLKFKDILGGTALSAYEYWCNWVKNDGDIFGIVKTDHVSHYGILQRCSYQFLNSLPTTKKDMEGIVDTTIKYVENLKKDTSSFVEYLRQNANYVNSYEMLASLYEWNNGIGRTKLFKTQKRKIINEYVNVLKKGKILQYGDNLTVLGNPYAMLLYAVGENWENDPTLGPEEGVIQVYTKRFNDGEYLCGIRSPQNGPSNLGYFHNVRHPLMEKYFDFSPNIMAVNCIHTDVQARQNGEDFDSDFNFVTNQPEMVKAVKKAYELYPTVVNMVPESSTSYDNTMKDYAIMDSKMQSAQKAIGGASDTAQLALSYYYDRIEKGIDDEVTKQLYENVCILAVLA